jgi:DNA-binding transcriptional LysR family regulator
MKGFNLDYLATFRSVIELGSFSAAAERHGLTQPAVSLQVRQLEKRLGASLVERVGRVARPTLAGSQLLQHADHVEAAVTAAMEAVAQHGSGTPGRVRLGTGATACIFLLPPLLARLRRQLPGLEITVSTGNTGDMLKAIEENLMDVGLLTLPASGRSLETIPVLRDDFLLIAPEDMALPDRITAANLAELPLLLFEPGGNTRRIVDKWFASGGAAPEPVMSLGSVEAIKAMVEAGVGCSIVPGMSVNDNTRRRLVTRPLDPPLFRELAVVIRRDKKLSRGLRSTREALLALAGENGV